MMPDRETVITHLQIIHTWAAFARERDLHFFTPKHLEDIAQWSDDARDLLKEQEKQKFFVDESGKITPLPIVFPNCPLKEQEAVVRCKDCKHGKIHGIDVECVAHEEIGYDPEPWHPLDWFCADGERK